MSITVTSMACLSTNQMFNGQIAFRSPLTYRAKFSSIWTYWSNFSGCK